MSDAEPAIRIETREDLIFLLAEAAAIEHNLMACYLYAAWSLKRGERDGLTAEQAAAVARWRKAIVSVAVEEMGHLALVGNLATAIGGAPHFSRPNFPIRPGYHPSGVVLHLAPFSRSVLDHFIYLERPEGKELSDSAEFVHPSDYCRTHPRGRLMPSAQDYGTVGHLYRGIHHGLVVLTEHLGERALFCGDPASQINPTDASLPGLMLIHDLASAAEAVTTIVEQGEGAPRHSETNHYARFIGVRDEYERLVTVDPSFAPAFPVARNPTPGYHTDPDDCVAIELPEARRVLDISNALYGHVLRCLVQAYGRGAGDEAGRKLFVDTAIELMFVLAPVATYLASLPASRSHPGVNAGMTFTMLRDVARLPSGPSEKRVMAERLAEIAKRARHQFPTGHELAATAGQLDEITARFGVEGLRIVGHHSEAGK
ncbi:MAG: ferritin-like protein [Bauldia sp.]